MKSIDEKTVALDLMDKLYAAGAVSIHAGDKNYLTSNDEIADTASRRELEAILIRLGIFKPSERLTKSLANVLCSALTLRGIHIDQWLADRKHQNDLDELNILLADYATHSDLGANDTRLRIEVLKIAKKHATELQKTHVTQPLDLSIHVARIKKNLTTKGVM